MKTNLIFHNYLIKKFIPKSLKLKVFFNINFINDNNLFFIATRQASCVYIQRVQMCKDFF